MMTLTQHQRLERILVKLAQEHAPHLIHNGWTQTPDAIKHLARGLAEYNILILMGNVPNHLLNEREKVIHRWVSAYADFHKLFALTLFPSYDGLQATFADDGSPTIVVLRAQICPIVEMMAGYVVPFVASRQAHTHIYEAELRILMDKVLQGLCAEDLAQPVYNVLVKDGMAVAQRLLRQPIQQIALTNYDQVIFREVAKPTTLPKTGALNGDKSSDGGGSPSSAAVHLNTTPNGARSTQTQEQPIFQDEYKLEELADAPEVTMTSTSRMFTPLLLGAERKTKTGTPPPVPELPIKK